MHPTYILALWNAVQVKILIIDLYRLILIETIFHIKFNNNRCVFVFLLLISVYGSSADLNVAVDDGDASLYNGDANHKVWNGSQDQLDSIVMESPYDMYSGNTSTLGRPARQRQMSQPIDVPPPPMKEESSKKRKDKKSSKSSSSQSLSGTLIRPKPIHPAAMQRHGMAMGHGPGPGNMIYGVLPGPPPPPMGRNYHTISHRGFPPGPPQHHHHHHPGHHPGMPPQMHPQMMHGPPHMGVPMQVPIMMPQQYATLQPSTTTKKKKKDKKNTGIPVGMPIVPPIYAYHHAQSMGGPAPPPPQSVMAQSMTGEPRPLSMSSRKLAASMGNGLDDSGNSGAESPGGTGIYRRKGHLNERAFSYSIRQEHRSRSHGSLASLQFNPPDMKKEREIAQMVAGLDLNDGSEDPRSMGPATLQRKQAAMMNGNGAIYGNGGGQAIYGNGPASSFGKPRR